ncbi:hypothetical protein E1287_07500 [Actinomadura sp. KC06]|uniref:hypothetical protein n=1 Tax=Actinomadura sp. KC06 TaxID=2530369 RepID=UPI0010435BD7|nr:hypothetical protein [Actinomadura sp. KC06]TDD37893.1 hypothetical protein E1287_07500 [Actinomadura sp. KC06]
MKLHVTAWPRINGQKHQPGDEVDVDDLALARMLIREGQAREAGTPEPLAGGPAASQRAAQVDAGLAGEPTQPAGDGAAGADGADAGAAGEEGPSAKPGRGASHADWVAYATGQGMEADAAEKMSRAQLSAHFAGS